MYHTSKEESISTNWLPTSKGGNQCINTITLKFVNKTCPYYLEKKRICSALQDTRNKFAKLKIPFCKTNMAQKAISFVGPSLWKSLPALIKKTNNLRHF